MPDLEHLQKYYSKEIKPFTFQELLELKTFIDEFDLFTNLLGNNEDKMEKEENDLPPVNDPHGYSLDD